MFRRILAAAVLSALAGSAHASALPSYFMTLTETPTGLQVTSNLPTYDNFPPSGFVPDINPSTESNHWQYGPQPSGFVEFFPSSGADGAANYYSIAWHDPGTGNFNVLTMAPSGNLGDTTFVAVSDVTASGLYGFYNFGGFGTPNVNFHTSCFEGGSYIDCPTLPDGGTFTMPISFYGQPRGTVAFTYIDHDGLGRDPNAVPEPAAWALMITGFGLAGAALRRRGPARLTAR